MKELEDENGMLKQKVNILEESLVICWTILITSVKLAENFEMEDCLNPLFLEYTHKSAVKIYKQRRII